MPTGYTAKVKSGEITDFGTFAMECARAFGALVDMRDDPSGTPIPHELKPNEFFRTSLEASKAELDRLSTMTPEDAEKECQAEHDREVQYRVELEERRRIELARYRAMLARVNAWEPPSKDHMELKSFMQDQIARSIQFDCGEPRAFPVKLTPSEWRTKKLVDASRSVSYDEKAWAEEQARVANRNTWLRLLRESLKEVSQ